MYDDETPYTRGSRMPAHPFEVVPYFKLPVGKRVFGDHRACVLICRRACDYVVYEDVDWVCAAHRLHLLTTLS